MKTNTTARMLSILGVLLLASTALSSCTGAEKQTTFPSPTVLVTSTPTPTPTPTPELSCESVATPKSHQDEVNNAAKKSGLDPSIIAAIIQTQSNWKVEATSPVGTGKGLALMSDTIYAEYGEGDIFNVHNAVQALGNYLEHLADTLKGRSGIGADYTDLVVAALVVGEKPVLEAGEVPDIKSVKKYVEKVNTVANQIKSCAQGGS